MRGLRYLGRYIRSYRPQIIKKIIKVNGSELENQSETFLIKEILTKLTRKKIYSPTSGAAAYLRMNWQDKNQEGGTLSFRKEYSKRDSRKIAKRPDLQQPFL
jgi:hypothetical protein